MKQVSNTLLTFCPIPFKAYPDASAFPRDMAGAKGRRCTPFYIRRKKSGLRSRALPGLSRSPRSIVRIGLGEGSVRNLLHRVFGALPVLVLSIFLSCSFAGGGPAMDVKHESAVGKGTLPNLDEVSAALKKHIQATTCWDESEISIHPVGGLNGVELPSGDIQLRLAPGMTMAGRKRVLAPLEAVQEGKTVRSFWITADVSIRARILTASRKIPYNKALLPEDIAEDVVDVPDIRSDCLRQSGELIGKVARRSFSRGDLLTREAFADPFLVRRGDTVQLRLERNGIILTSLVRAEQNGKLGQIITVRNLEFSKPVKAQVAGPGAVRIQ